MALLRHISDLLGLGVGPAGTLLAVVAAFVVATVLRGIRLLLRPNETSWERWRSLGTWWALLVLLVAMLLLGRAAVVVVFGALSLLALHEAVGLTGRRGWLPAAAGLAVVVYGWAWLDWRTLFTGVLPIAAVVLVAAEAGWRRWLRPRHEETRAAVIAFLEAVVGPAFVVAVASLPGPDTLPGNRMGWLVLLLLLAELNDIAQAFWGRTLGRLRMAPVLSPKKTWEGFWGGLLTTTAASVLVAPALTDYGRGTPPGAGALGVPVWVWAAVLGGLVAVGGVAGDLVASRLKRRAGVKDSGRLLPGHGGVLDRIDSVAVAAPTFFALTWLLWFRP